MAVRSSVEVWILRAAAEGDRVLLLRKRGREDGPRPHPPFWQPVTGGVEAGESAADAAVREVREETGLVIDPVQLRVVVEEFEVVVDAELTVRKRVFAAATDDERVSLDGVEHDDARWTAPDEVDAMLTWPSNRTTWAALRGQWD